MSISSDLFLAILSMDSYNRGYGAGIEIAGNQIGAATILVDSETVFNDPTADPTDLSPAAAAGFYAVAYTVGAGVDGIAAGTTVISYRGTDQNISTPWSDDPGSDLWNGYGAGVGASINDQAHLAAEFYQSVTGTSEGDGRQGAAILTGHSLGGGLAGATDEICFTTGNRSAWVHARDAADPAGLVTSPVRRRGRGRAMTRKDWAAQGAFAAHRRSGRQGAMGVAA